jgi:hypothetical protein
MRMRQKLMFPIAIAVTVGLSPLLAVAQDAPAPPPPTDAAPETPPAAPPAQAAEAPAAGYGLSKAEAIEVCYPEGQRQYLARLVCPDRSHPRFERAGSVGPRQEMPDEMSETMMRELLADMREPRKREPGEPDFHIVDAYEVDCGGTATTLYLDMYHCAQERPTRAPEGFTILD